MLVLPDMLELPEYVIYNAITNEISIGDFKFLQRNGLQFSETGYRFIYAHIIFLGKL